MFARVKNTLERGRKCVGWFCLFPETTTLYIFDQRAFIIEKERYYQQEAEKTEERKKSRELKWYLVKLSIRILLFLGVFTLWILGRENLASAITEPFAHCIPFLAFLWIFFILMMASHLFPTRLLTIAGRKTTAAGFSPTNGYDKAELASFQTFQNRQALKVLLVCLVVNAVFGILYLTGFTNAADMLMLTMVYFLCDYIFILFFCPCQTIFMKNKCCINCRIYDWGHFLMFIPMVFVGGVFGLTLFFMSLLVLFRWEVLWRRHPERFFEGSNKNLQCANCKEKTCQIKTAVSKRLRGKHN